MSTDSYPTNWSVLILCTGYGNELLRSFVRETVENLGFDTHVYDSPGYPVDPTMHSHAACVKAISSHDIILALADENEGGEFQIAQAPEAMLQHLRDRGIVPAAGSSDPLPTIFQVEVMTARDLEKPTIVFIGNDLKTRIDQTLAILGADGLTVTPRIQNPPPLKDLIKEKNWDEIARCYNVPTGRIKSFRQIAFLENVRKQEPNFVSYYDSNDQNALAREIKSRLSGVVEVYIREHISLVNNKIQTKRNPIGTESLQDLFNQGLIISSPFKVLSGDIQSPLFSTNGERGQIASSLVSKKDVLLLGSPGIGKTTASLFSFRDLARESGADLEGYAPLYASWRMLTEFDVNPARITSVGDFIKLLIGSALARPPWPASMDLPDKGWILVLDGLDESLLSRTSLVPLIEVIAKEATLLVTCRRYDYERYLQRVKEYFNSVIQLLTWEEEDVAKYLLALEAKGKTKAHAFISDYVNRREFPDFITLPLWLSMLTFLTERSGSQDLIIDLTESPPYELLRLCADAVAEDELNRQGVRGISREDLRTLWGRCAWLIQKSRRDRRALRIPELEIELSIQESTLLGKAVFAPLDTFGDQVYGFFHEVFREYWLAEYLVDRLVDNEIDAQGRADYFSYQRSRETNGFVRWRIKSREDIEVVSSRLQEAIRSTGRITARALFAKNQLVYLLGRIDESETNRSFLSGIWNSSEESLFVKHSAAFGAIMLGDPNIEKEYYELLKNSDIDDQMNRGYHLYYYKDLDVPESAIPVIDDGQSDGERTMRQLFKRLIRSETRNLNLRRIELLTLRRFLETGRIVPADISDPQAIVAKTVADARSHALSDSYIKGVEEEAELVLSLLSS
jgi:hypothetical protein